MRMLSGYARRYIDDTQTMIVVDVNRLHEEYEMGKIDQMKDEHWRKQIRIGIGLSVTAISTVSFLLGYENALFLALFIHCVAHVIL